jgi:putative endonuclease
MSSTDTGRKAEIAARVYLEMRGYTILEQNWRRPYAEVDIIARKDDTLHFVEVKYRRNDDQGSGLDAITPTKLKRMVRGADSYVQETKWPSGYVLSAIELAGPNFAVLNFVDQVLF